MEGTDSGSGYDDLHSAQAGQDEECSPGHQIDPVGETRATLVSIMEDAASSLEQDVDGTKVASEGAGRARDKADVAPGKAGKRSRIGGGNEEVQAFFFEEKFGKRECHEVVTEVIATIETTEQDSSLPEGGSVMIWEHRSPF